MADEARRGGRGLADARIGSGGVRRGADGGKARPVSIRHPMDMKNRSEAGASDDAGAAG
ncbi:hypothetical protein [Pleomorphomonas carboxyditropha]|uniref:hypothetical protein n=1 Tax=Pleomorphomonas carboxyditropha TaxID=2023338 RepID=UPI0013FE2FCE|nr:hypothetical protein [Pleomorphomonas carboxyditropha]